KVNVEVNSDYTGVIVEILAEEDEDVEVGDVIAKVDENAEAIADTADSAEDDAADAAKEETTQQAEQEQPLQQDAPAAQKQADDKDVIASPAARKRARELNIDLSTVQPRDPLGRVRPEDVEAAAKGESGKKADQPAQAKKETAKTPERTEFDKPVERVKMSRRRQTIAKNLVNVQQESAMLTTFNEVDMTNIMKLRSERKEQFQEKHGVKLGFMSFFTKAVVGALKDFPLLNAEIQGNELVIKKFYYIGIAVSTDDGLVVPVVRDADRLDFAGVEREIARLGKKAREKELHLDDLQGGTFTITNGGIFGSMLSTPI